jgi:N-methylhydantoinase A
MSSKRAIRLAVDTGGTFTDLVVEDASGALGVFKSPTTPHDPVRGVLDVVAVAARQRGVPREQLLSEIDMFIYGTTHAINAILTDNTAKTALLVTEGHRDMLLLREGGRVQPFDQTRAYPRPYVPRALTFGVPERVGSAGEVVLELDEDRVIEIAGELRRLEVEAVGVCLLWSIVNDAHERRIGELLEQHLSGVPYTLSHRLNPIMREYRRASSTVIDASLKPLMIGHIESLSSQLRGAGFDGRLLVISSTGAVLDAEDIAAMPIHCLNSGPSMAPVAGRYYAQRDAGSSTAIIADTGGTSYDVSLVRGGRIPRSEETWLGEVWFGHMTGFPSVDVKSIGAGGGSIASVDSGGLLHVGPASAGAVPGPVCYGRGGTRPTLTDACLVLGYIDPDYFAGGSLELQADAAREALREHVAEPLGLGLDEAAHSVVTLATEHMVRAIEDITINQGIDVRGGILVGGGGAAGLNSVAIARRLGCSTLLIPETGAALSAAGALMSELSAEFAAAFPTSAAAFDFDGANRVLGGLEEQCRTFAAGPGAHALEVRYDYTAEARYANQMWDLEVPLGGGRFRGEEDVHRLVQGFHHVHEQIFAVAEPDSIVNVTRLRARVSCRLREDSVRGVDADAPRTVTAREVYFAGAGRVQAPVHHLAALAAGDEVEGPAVVESAITTVVVDPGAVARLTDDGGLSISVEGK